MQEIYVPFYCAVTGPQGCGKGTQGKMLSDILRLPNLSMGQLLRDALSNPESPDDKKMKDMVDSGQLVPATYTHHLLLQALQKNCFTKGFILDGYPRTLDQCSLLDAAYPLRLLIVLDIPDEVAIERVSGRLTCSKCGLVYHPKFAPPPFPNTCKCGGKLEVRADDKPEVVKRRLKLYHDETEPVIQHYNEKGIVKKVDAGPIVPKVFQAVFETVHPFL